MKACSGEARVGAEKFRMGFMNIGKTWLVYTQAYIPIQDGRSGDSRELQF